MYCFHKKNCRFYFNIFKESDLSDDFTLDKPFGFRYAPHFPNQHYDFENNCWVLDDDCDDRAFLDSINKVSAVKVVRTLRGLQSRINENKTCEDDLFDLLEQHLDYKHEWEAVGEFIYLDDDTVTAIVNALNIHLDDLKRMIVENG